MGRKRSYSGFSSDNSSATFSSGGISWSSKGFSGSSGSQLSESQRSASDSQAAACGLRSSSQNISIRNDERSLHEYFSEFKSEDCADIQCATQEEEDESLEENTDFDTGSVPLKSAQPQTNPFAGACKLALTIDDDVATRGGCINICGDSREKQKHTATVDPVIPLRSVASFQPQLQRFFKSVKPVVSTSERIDRANGEKLYSSAFANNSANSDEKQLNATLAGSANLITNWFKFKRPEITTNNVNSFKSYKHKKSSNTNINKFEKLDRKFQNANGENKGAAQSKTFKKSTKFAGTENITYNKENSIMQSDLKRIPALEIPIDGTDIFLKSPKPQSNQQNNKHFNYAGLLRSSEELSKATGNVFPCTRSKDSSVSVDPSLRGPMQLNDFWEKKFGGFQKCNSLGNDRKISANIIPEGANSCNDINFSTQKSSNFSGSDIQNLLPYKSTTEQLYKPVNYNFKNKFLGQSSEIGDSPTFDDFENIFLRTSTPKLVQNSEIQAENQDIEENLFKHMIKETNTNLRTTTEDAVYTKDSNKSILSPASNDSVNSSNESYVFLRENITEEPSALYSEITFAPDDACLHNHTDGTNINASFSKAFNADFEDNWSTKLNAVTEASNMDNHGSNFFENEHLNISNTKIDQTCSQLNIGLFSNISDELKNTSPKLNDLLSCNIPLLYEEGFGDNQKLASVCDESLRSPQPFSFNKESLLEATGKHSLALVHLDKADDVNISSNYKTPRFPEKAYARPSKTVESRRNQFGGDTNIALDRSSGSEALSTGSRENFSELDKRLREGMNRITRDKSLVYAGPRVSSVLQKEQKTNFLKTKIPQIFQQLILHAQQGKHFEFTLTKGTMWKNCPSKNEGLKKKWKGNPLVVKFKHNKPSRFSTIVFLLGKIYGLLMANSVCTQREIYYQYINNLNNQRQINDGMEIISAMLGVEPWYFPIVPTSKGLVFGDLTIVISSTEITQCNSFGGTLIPQDVTKIKELKSKAFFILVVEKDAIFKKLLDEDIPNKFTRPFIVITGKGFPDINTRLFVKLLWVQLRIPVFILVDGDPHGIEIMLTYRFGSANLIHWSDELALPEIRWLGIHPSEIITLNITHQPLSEIEKRKVETMLARPYVHENAWLKRELEVLIERNFKAEIEGVIRNNTYLTDFYLANKFYSQGYF